MEDMLSRINFPTDCKVVGNVLVSKNGEIEVRRVYVEGVHKELHFLGPIICEQRKGGGFQTEVTITTGLPSEVFLG